MVNKAANSSIPIKHCGRRGKHKPLPYWNDGIRRAIYDRNRARNKISQANTPENIENYKHLKGVAQHVIKESAKTHWHNFCNTMSSATGLSSVWNMAKCMNGIQPNVACKHLNSDNGDTLEWNTDKAELLAHKFAEVSSTANYSEKFQKWKDELESDCNLLNNDVETDERNIHLNIPFSQHELGRALRQAKQNTSPGEDGILYECLKKLPGAGQRILLKLYNVIWETGKLPHDWTHSIELPILKAGKHPHQPSSYRPIALTSTLCKIMERVVANRLVWYLEKHSILSNLQTGFRKNRCTLDELIRLQDTVNRSLRNRSHTLEVFLDFEKAFDMYWRT